MTITVKNYKDIIHNYPNAPQEVYYLKNNHRHTIKFKTTIQVFDIDRELEFYMLKDRIDNFLNDISSEVCWSCERYGVELLKYITNKYPDRTVTVSVYEDNGYYVTINQEDL